MVEPVKLSPKQGEVCRMVARGMSSKEIAVEMGISHRTVEWHRQAAYQRLQVRNAIELVNKLNTIGASA